MDIISYESGKTAIAEVANALARNYGRDSTHTKPEEFTLSLNELKQLVESKSGIAQTTPNCSLTVHVEAKTASRRLNSWLYTTSLPLHNPKLCLSCLDFLPGISVLQNSSKHHNTRHICRATDISPYSYSIYPSSWWTHSFLKRERTDTYIPFQETDLRRALDQYAGAEMRLGK